MESLESPRDARNRFGLQWMLRSFFRSKAFHRHLVTDVRCETEAKGQVKKKQTPTFEYESPVRGPDVDKSPPIGATFEKYPTRDIGEHVYRVCVPIVIMFDRANGLVPVCIWRCRRKTMVKVRVLRESETVPATTEVPKNFLQPRTVSELLWPKVSDNRNDVGESQSPDAHASQW